MKKIFWIVSVFVISQNYISQKINFNVPSKGSKVNGASWSSGYQYIVTNDITWGVNKNIYGINNQIKKLFNEKGFGTYDNPLDGDFSDINPNSLYNPCINLYVSFSSDGTAGDRSVKLFFRNCKNEIVFQGSTTLPRTSYNWTLDYQKKINWMLSPMKYLKVKYDSLLTPKIDYPELEITNETENTLRAYYDSNNEDLVEGVYRNIKDPKDPGFNMKVGVKKRGNEYVGIVLEKMEYSKFKKGEVKFVLEESAVNSIFPFKFYMGNKYPQDGTAILEDNVLLTFNYTIGDINKDITFMKLYPKISSKSSLNPNNSDSNWSGNGSGIIISKDGYIVTNNHVVENMNDFEVEFKYAQEIRSFHAKVVKTDPTNDLAILKIDDQNFNDFKSIPYNFYTRSADVGTEVFALGYPMALSVMGKDIKFTDGRISSKTGYMGDITTYQTTTPIQPGNSGGPLFDHNANLLGINSSGLRKDVADNVSYTIKTNYLVNLIDVLPKTIPLPSTTWIASKPLTEQIKILSNYVVLIKVR